MQCGERLTTFKCLFLLNAHLPFDTFFHITFSLTLVILLLFVYCEIFGKIKFKK